MRGIISTLAIVWRIASPYFYSEDRWAGRMLLGAVVAIELSIVGITVLLNSWRNAFYNALQDRNWDAFIYQLGYFCVLGAIFIVLAVYQLYLNQWLQIRWRRWLTRHYLEHWLLTSNHYRMQLLGDAADNPDQRIAEDVKQFIDAGRMTNIGILPIGLGLLNSIVTLVSFAIILWNLSDEAPLHIFGTTLAIPGYLFWAALIYAIIGTALTHFVGRALIALNFQQQRYEADFRFNLVRVRENSEQIALLEGEGVERNRLLTRFGNVVINWMAIMSRQKKLTFLTAGYGQISAVFPYVVVSPAYFAGKMQLGGLMQTASAFDSVQSALSFFINVYAQMAEWRAVVERLAGFDESIAAAKAAANTPPVIALTPGDAGQLDAVPCTGRGLALWRRHDRGAEKCARDDHAAAPLLSNCATCCGGRLSRRAGQLRCRQGRGADHCGRSAGTCSPHRGGGALEPDAFAWRTATIGNRTGPALRTRFPFPG